MSSPASSAYSMSGDMYGKMESMAGDKYSMEGADSVVSPAVASAGDFASSGNNPVAVPYPIRRIRRPPQQQQQQQLQHVQRNHDHSPIRFINLGGDDSGSEEESSSASSFFKSFMKRMYEPTDNTPTILTL